MELLQKPLHEKMFLNARSLIALIISRDHRRMPFEKWTAQSTENWPHETGLRDISAESANSHVQRATVLKQKSDSHLFRTFHRCTLDVTVPADLGEISAESAKSGIPTFEFRQRRRQVRAPKKPKFRQSRRTVEWDRRVVHSTVGRSTIGKTPKTQRERSTVDRRVLYDQ